MKEIRCDWANKTELEKHYHDTQWGKPIHHDQELFKMLMLGGENLFIMIKNFLRC